LIQQSTRRPNKRVSLAVLGIARLLAHQHNMSSIRALTQHRLSGALPQLTAPAGLRSLTLGGGWWLRWAAGSHDFLYIPRRRLAVGAAIVEFSSRDQRGGSGSFRTLNYKCNAIAKPRNRCAFAQRETGCVSKLSVCPPSPCRAIYEIHRQPGRCWLVSVRLHLTRLRSG